jgi:hypothetical protein
VIQTTTHPKINRLMDNTYEKLSKKLEALKTTQTHKTKTHMKQHTFYENKLNLTKTETDQGGIKPSSVWRLRNRKTYI